MVADNDVALVVLGYPLSLTGERGPRAALAEEFAEALRAILDVPVELHDERLSTAEAERSLRAAGARGRQRRELVDRSAATVILQSFLEASR